MAMIMGLRVYLLAGAAAVVVAAAGALWWQSNKIEKLRVDNASLRASVRSMALERDLARDAQAVADARAKWAEEKAGEYDAIREGILRDGEDADLPDWLRDVLVGLRPGTDHETDLTPDPE